MRYFRLLKDTPEHLKDTVFFLNDDGWYHRVDSLNNFVFAKYVVEDQPEWFEEVISIYVKPYNAETLQKIDDMADATVEIRPIPMDCEECVPEPDYSELEKTLERAVEKNKFVQIPKIFPGVDYL